MFAHRSSQFLSFIVGFAFFFRAAFVAAQCSLKDARAQEAEDIEFLSRPAPRPTAIVALDGRVSCFVSDLRIVIVSRREAKMISNVSARRATRAASETVKRKI